MSFTKGPWEVKPEEFNRPYIRIRGTALGGKYKIANVLGLSKDGELYGDDEETRANAHLIAAAPELYEALEKISVAIQHNTLDQYAAMMIIKELLAKARGES